MTMDVIAWIAANAEKVGIIAVLLGTVYALIVGLLVPRPFYDRAVADVSELRTRYDRLQLLAERAAAAAIARTEGQRR